jgi:hypothetical protein
MSSDDDFYSVREYSIFNGHLIGSCFEFFSDDLFPERQRFGSSCPWQGLILPSRRKIFLNVFGVISTRKFAERKYVNRSVVTGS